MCYRYDQLLKFLQVMMIMYMSFSLKRPNLIKKNNQ